MRKPIDMLHRTMPEYRHIVFGAILSLSLAGCTWDSELRGVDLGPSEYSIARGYPTLMPVTHFRIADYVVPDPSDLEARFAMLKRKMRALIGPVIPPTDRARLEAAVKRKQSAQG